MPTFYSIWKTTKTDGNQPKKMNMTVAQATTYIVKNRDSLKPGEQFFTENQSTNEVDMMFTKRDTITPNKPMWLDGNRLVSKNPKTNPQKSMSNYGNPAWSNGSTNKKSRKKQDEENFRFEQYIRQGMTVKQAKTQMKRDELYFQRIGKKSDKPYTMKPSKFGPGKTQSKKSRGKWVGNMFRLSTKRLNQIKKTGTPKQQKLAINIISKRKK